MIRGLVSNNRKSNSLFLEVGLWTDIVDLHVVRQFAQLGFPNLKRKTRYLVHTEITFEIVFMTRGSPISKHLLFPLSS